jgi:hypothetical protein
MMCKRVEPQTCLMQTFEQLQALACLGHPFLSADVTAAILSLRHRLSSICIFTWDRKGFKRIHGIGKPRGQFRGARVVNLKAGLQHVHTNDTMIVLHLQRSIRLHAHHAPWAASYLIGLPMVMCVRMLRSHATNGWDSSPFVAPWEPLNMANT